LLAVFAALRAGRLAVARAVARFAVDFAARFGAAFVRPAAFAAAFRVRGLVFELREAAGRFFACFLAITILLSRRLAPETWLDRVLLSSPAEVDDVPLSDVSSTAYRKSKAMHSTARRS
jgi:hypothetical protein